MEIKYEVVITDECNNEMDKICDYIRQNLFADRACNRMLEEIVSIIDALEHSPFMYEKVTKYKHLDKEYRRVIIKNYVILYDIDEKKNIVYLDHMFYGKSNYINKI